MGVLLGEFVPEKGHDVADNAGSGFDGWESDGLNKSAEEETEYCNSH